MEKVQWQGAGCALRLSNAFLVWELLLVQHGLGDALFLAVSRFLDKVVALWLSPLGAFICT